MKTSPPLFSSTRRLPRYLGAFAIVLIVALIGFYLFHYYWTPLAVGITGVQQMGEDFNIPEFYVNGYSGGSIGKEGGGGSDVCCVLLPPRWRPGLIADIRWLVADRSKENAVETQNGNYQSIKWTYYRAIVPVEKYLAEPEQLYVHFFSDGKVRVVSSAPGSESKRHPIQRHDPHAADSATLGTVVSSIFTDEEIKEMRRKDDERREKYGDWR